MLVLNDSKPGVGFQLAASGIHFSNIQPAADVTRFVTMNPAPCGRQQPRLYIPDSRLAYGVGPRVSELLYAPVFDLVSRHPSHPSHWVSRCVKHPEDGHNA